MVQSPRSVKQSHERFPDAEKPKNPSDSAPIDPHPAVTFPVRWRFYSLVWFLAVGTSVSLLLAPLLVLGPLSLADEIYGTISNTWGWVYYGLGAVLWLLWFGYRLRQDFRATVTFTPAGITLRTRCPSASLTGLLLPQLKQQTFTWAEIRHIEVLPDVMAVQFPTTAVVLHPTPQQHVQLLALTQKCLLQPQQVMRETQVILDFRSRPSAENFFSFIAYPNVYGAMGGLVGGLMAAMISAGSEWLFMVILLGYVGGYVLVGGLRWSTGSRRVILTPQGILEVSFPKPKRLWLFEHRPLFEWWDFPLPAGDPVLVPWMPWAEITHYKVYYDSILFQSPQGLLEIWGLAKRGELKAQILKRVRGRLVGETRMTVYT